MIIPILICATRIGAIWAKKRVARNLLMSATQSLLLVAIYKTVNQNEKNKNN